MVEKIDLVFSKKAKISLDGIKIINNNHPNKDPKRIIIIFLYSFLKRK